MNKGMATAATVLFWAMIYGVLYALIWNDEWGRLGYIIVVTLFAPAVIMTLPLTWVVFARMLMRLRSPAATVSEPTDEPSSKKLKSFLILAIVAWMINFAVVTLYMMNR